MRTFFRYGIKPLPINTLFCAFGRYYHHRSYRCRPHRSPHSNTSVIPMHFDQNNALTEKRYPLCCCGLRERIGSDRMPLNCCYHHLSSSLSSLLLLFERSSSQHTRGDRRRPINCSAFVSS